MSASYRHARRRTAGLVALAMAAVALAVGVGVASSANYDTYYCGTATSWCTLGSGAYQSTAGVALRDDNYVSCISDCWTHVWYDDGSGAYYVTHTYGASSVDIGLSSAGDAYSRCETDSGYGSYSARCHTTWHD